MSLSRELCNAPRPNGSTQLLYMVSEVEVCKGSLELFELVVGDNTLRRRSGLTRPADQNGREHHHVQWAVLVRFGWLWFNLHEARRCNFHFPATVVNIRGLPPCFRCG
jgi:hypothetical protein